MTQKLGLLFRSTLLAILILSQFMNDSPAQAAGSSGDGTIHRYAILIHGWGEEDFWWQSSLKAYNSLAANDFDSIYFLYRHGADDPQVTEPSIVNGAATLHNIRSTFSNLASLTDADDEVLVWMVGHGAGYDGADIQDPSQYGYLSAFTSVDPGDEEDYLESNFKLQALTTSGNYGENHGMNQWRVVYVPGDENQARVYRHQFVSRFSKTYFTRGGLQSDQDAYLEEWIDYLTIDTERDGIIDPHVLPDTDGDGIPYYNPDTGVFDEDEWGKMDEYTDNIRLTTYAPGLLVDYVIHDFDYDNLVDIDLHYRPGDPLESDGEDTDGAGLFDGLDVNENGNMNDWISIDEDFPLPTSRLTDDNLNSYLDMLNVRAVTVIIAACYSGGFIWDISSPGRVIVTNTGEEVYGYATNFSDELADAISSDAAEADVDQNGGVSITEAFNYATSHDRVWCGNNTDPIDTNDPPDCEEPLLDDNGDLEGSVYLDIISGQSLDGTFASTVFLK